MGPRLVYDGDCGFCRYTLEYARGITGDAVEYRPYQEVAEQHSEVSEAEFAVSIRLFVGSEQYQGARAAFETLALGGRRGWRWIYLHLPAMAALCEWLYRLTSTHRDASYRIARLAFGSRLGPRTHLQTADWLYRGIALCGCVAFLSFWWQAAGLVGRDGVLPAGGYLDLVASAYGVERYWLLPTVFWVNAGDLALHVVCVLGVVATSIGLLGRLRLLTAFVAYVCYLSLVHAGQVFMAYQWDALLVECLVVAAILARAPTLGVWLARLLLFRFMLLSGAAKLFSGDATWADASALQLHFETQPLPTAVAWYAHQLPAAALRWGVYATFVVELALPFLIFCPRNLRLLAGVGFVALEVLILLTGSYNFFNLLTIVLCVGLLDDGKNTHLRGVAPPLTRRWGAILLASLIAVQGAVILGASLTRRPAPPVLQVTAPFYIANPYGLFAVMTKQREELVIEGTLDGKHWHSYEFPFKPGAVGRTPGWAALHQPRLDWQMWFAALGPPERASWIYDLVFALLEARPVVLRLLDDPFQGQRPSAIRVVIYRYQFTSFGQRAHSGDWWVRSAAEEWLGPIVLRRPKVTHEPLELK